MSNTAEDRLDSFNQFLVAAANNRHAPMTLTDGMRVLHALVDDMGPRMTEELRRRWLDKMNEILSDRGENSYDLTVNTQNLYVGALRGLQAYFCDVVQEDCIAAGRHYEQAARTINLIPESLGADELLGAPPKEDGTASLDEIMCVAVDLIVLRLPIVDLWDRAGDAYCRGGSMEDAKRCYEAGIETLRVSYPDPQEPGRADLARLRGSDVYHCHLLLSLANVLVVSKEAWDKTEALYMEAADSVFFSQEEKSNDQYYDLCGLLAQLGATGFSFSRRKRHLPHVWVPLLSTGQRENMLKLATEIGQRALEELIREYDVKESFPVPETCYLLGILGHYYSDLGQYQRCADFFPRDTKLAGAYWEWTWVELEELAGTAFEWVQPHVAFCFQTRFAHGLMQRPDYKEFVEHIKQIEASHNRQELRIIRQERILRDMDRTPSTEETRSKLLHEYPWLGDLANLGSLVNAEDLLQRLGNQNWSEVVVGYCNAVEEQLKRSVYKEYLAFRASFDKHYAEESERQRETGSVLSFIAGITRNPSRRQLWDRFVAARMHGYGDILRKELPVKLSELVPMRNRAAHGETLDRKSADRVRRIVLGRPSETGLLEKLSKIRVE